MQGIDLHSGVFDEPKDAAATGASPISHRQRWLDNRKERFAHVLGAVDELVDWVKTERRHFIERVLGVPPKRITRRCKRNTFVDIDEAEHHGADVELGPTPEVATDGGHWRQCNSEEREARDHPVSNFVHPRGFRRQRAVEDIEADLAAASGATPSGAAPGATSRGAASGVDIGADAAAASGADIDADLAAASGATPSGAAPGATLRGAASGASPSEAQCDKGCLDSLTHSMLKVELDQKKLGSSDEQAIVDSLWREVRKAVVVTDSAPQCLPGRDCDEEEIANDSDVALGDTSSGSSGEDDIGTSGEVGLPPGSAESACPNQSEPEAPRSEDWVMVTSRPLAALGSGGQSGAVRIVPWPTWRSQKEKDIVAGLPPRERALMSYSRIFAGGVLTNTELDEESLRPYVQLVFEEFSGKLWPLREDDIAKTMRNVPPEALRDISSEEFFAEYHRLRCWLGAMRASPVGREVLSLSRCRVAKNGCASGHWQKDFWVDVASVIEARDHTYIPAIGSSIHVKRQGQCRVLEVETRVCNTRLHRFIMSTRYEEIRALQVWHVVRAYHRCTLLAVPSESIAECVGSVLADAAGRGSGRPKDVTSFIQSTTVRMCGLHGHGDEEGILADALNTHFNGEGPECWHMRRRGRSAGHQDGAAMTRAILRRRMRLQHCPPWVSSTLRDVVHKGEQVYCKKLPCPQDFSGMPLAAGSVIRKRNLSVSGDSGKRHRGATSSARRELLEVAKSEVTPSTLSETLWSMLPVSSSSIAHTHRPGKSFR